MFKFRDKKELLGMILGAICFIPSFLVAFVTSSVTNLSLGILLMLLSQFLWLTSISLCTSSLERENRELKDKLNKEMNYNE
jgi:ABC-type polysaccharide/polyol phosphate export permease